MDNRITLSVSTPQNGQTQLKVGAQRVNKNWYWFSYFCSYKFSHSTDDCLNEILNSETDSESISTQPVFSCSKLTIETLQQGLKYVQI